MFLRNIPIGKRILFGLLPLIIALLLQSVVLIHQQVLDTERGHILSGLVDVAIQTNAVIHELQRERGASALFVGSKGSQFARQMGEQRMATDQRIVSLEGVVGSLEAAMVDAFGSSAVQAVRMAVKRLPDLRKQIDSLEGRPIEIVSAYSEMIRILLGSVVRIGIVSPDVQTAQLISSYVALTDAKEAAGQERATGSAGFAAGKFDTSLYRRYVELGAEQRTAFTLFQRYASNTSASALKSALTPEIEEPVARMRNVAIDSLVTGAVGEVTGPIWFATATKRIDAMKSAEDLIGAEIRHRAEQIRDSARRSLILLSGGLLVLAIVTGTFVVAVVQSIIRPVSNLADVMRLASEGNYLSQIEMPDSRDEIGKMAKAVNLFQANMIRNQELEIEDRATKERELARSKKRVLLTADFDVMIRRIVAKLESAVKEVNTTSTQLHLAVQQTSEQSSAVAAAAEQASGNIQTVAVAAEELGASTEEISRRIQDTTQITYEAVVGVQSADETIEGLSLAAQKIGEIVSLISDIASQTNLLALNATIEAARAGSAGKGFAVVANEVKGLASQTAKATREIAEQIGGIQESTRKAVNVVKLVGGSIARVDEVVSSIAAAVEEQNAATQEIVRNIQEASDGNKEVTGNVSIVSNATASTREIASKMNVVAKLLEDAGSSLGKHVETFLDGIKTA